MDRFLELFHDHAAASLDKQLALGDMLEEHEWHFEMKSGRLDFTKGRFLSKKKYSYAAQILGTESDQSDSWLWAWANEHSDIPAQLLFAANRVRAFGEKENVPELTEPQIALGPYGGHHFAMVASGILGANCYYKGSHDSGSVVLLVRDQSFPQHSFEPASRIALVFHRLITAMEIEDHRRSFMSYLRHYKMEAVADGHSLAGIGANSKVTALFDDNNRLTNLTTETF